jgi:hypothetical protein
MMTFRTSNQDDLVVGSYWRYVDTGTHWREDGTTSYILRQSNRDGRANIQEIGGSQYVHDLSKIQILDWFIPFDENFRPGVVRISQLLTSARAHGIPVEVLQELLIKLEI